MSKVVLSDIGNVIVFFDNRLTSQELAKKSHLDAATIHARLFQGPQRLTRDLNLGQNIDEFRSLAMSGLGCADTMTPNEFDQAYTQVFKMNVQVIHLWKQLIERGVIITAVSDLDELRRNELERIGIMTLFQHTVFSFENGVTKPSKWLIELALSKSGVNAEDAIFVDDLAENLVPATELGVATHQYVVYKRLVKFMRTNGFAV